MTIKNVKHIEETLSILVGQPLRSFTRAGDMIVAYFGELVEVYRLKLDDNRQPIRDESGKTIRQKDFDGKYGIHSLCSMRFTCGDEVIFAKSDIFLPTDEQRNKEGFVWDTFDWHTHGNTSFDELVVKHFREGFQEYVVKAVKTNRFGDLTLTFENGFVLEFFADGSGYSENWRFGEINSTEPIIILTGNGIDTGGN